MNTTFLVPGQEFAVLARDFCAWCESESLGPTPYRSAAGWLAKLYAAALILPEVEPESAEPGPSAPPGAFDKAKRNLAPFWGQTYRQVFHPRPTNDDAPLLGDLGDDLTDVYSDIRGSLVLFEAGRTTEAVWQWRFDHETHWGQHAVGALFGIHHLYVSGLA